MSVLVLQILWDIVGRVRTPFALKRERPADTTLETAEPRFDLLIDVFELICSRLELFPANELTLHFLVDVDFNGCRCGRGIAYHLEAPASPTFLQIIDISRECAGLLVIQGDLGLLEKRLHPIEVLFELHRDERRDPWPVQEQEPDRLSRGEKIGRDLVACRPGPGRVKRSSNEWIRSVVQGAQFLISTGGCNPTPKSRRASTFPTMAILPFLSRSSKRSCWPMTLNGGSFIAPTRFSFQSRFLSRSSPLSNRAS